MRHVLAWCTLFLAASSAELATAQNAPINWTGPGWYIVECSNSIIATNECGPFEILEGPFATFAECNAKEIAMTGPMTADDADFIGCKSLKTKPS